MQRNSQRESDGLDWTTVGLSLGARGLDLRRPDDPGVMSELLNARFADERTLERRPGHTGRAVMDGSAFTAEKTVTDEWLYGHGTLLSLPSGVENAHHPVAHRGAGTFQFNDTDVVWTGDRLLVATEESSFRGASTFWARDGETLQDKGLPAYLPVQTDSSPPEGVSGDYLETCLTETYRFIAEVTTSTTITIWAIDRATGVVLDKSTVAAVDPISDLRLFVSGGTPVILYRATDLVMTNWTGSGWELPSTVQASVDAYDVAVVTGGFHVYWRSGTTLALGRFSGVAAVDQPYAFGTHSGYALGGITPNGPVAIDVAEDGRVGFAIASSTGIWVTTKQFDMEDQSEQFQITTDAGPWDALTIKFRRLSDTNGHYPLVVYACEGADTGVQIWERMASDPGVGVDLLALGSTTRFNSTIASKAFRVGDEVFCWLRASNSNTLYLIAGAASPQVCGIADREEAPDRALVMVNPDPLDEHTLTWVRTYDAGDYTRAGNARIGDINFLPQLSAARYGRSVYLAGSHVRCYDGLELGDAGFHDYPIVTGGVAGTTGALSNGDYRVRVYPVRYNRRGERFMGAAITSDAVTLASSDDSIAWTIKTVPVTNHDDVVLEVYRTEAGGTTYYYEGSVENDLDAVAVTFTSTMSDAALIGQPGDSHETGVASLDELEEFGPLGCAMLATAGDRLWGAGGQVPPGVVQFSKLYEQGEGAGFDAIAGTQVVDVQGGAVTSLVGFSDTVITAFLADRIYVVAGAGPDNYGQGGFGVPQLVLADGALNHAGTAVLPIGIVFWGHGGPRLLTPGFQTQNISEPVRALADTLTPTGVRVDFARREVVWYTSGGDALLWNYSSNSRWARWSGLPVAGCSPSCLVTPAGRLLTPDEDTRHDDGRRFRFTFATGNIRLEALLAGGVAFRRLGMAGELRGECSPRFRVYYDGSPGWSEEFRWEPAEGTWLTSTESVADLTPAEVDALETRDRSGALGTHKRVARQDCHYFRVEVSDVGDYGFTPWELSMEIGAKPGLGRTPVNTFSH